MRHEQEPSSDNQRRTENKGRAWERISPVGFNPPISLPNELFPFGGEMEGKIEGIRLALRREEHPDNGEKQPSGKENGQNRDGFEPFLSQEFQDGQLFVNNYGGNFSQKMELNRGAVERVLGIAHLGDRVFLSSLQQSRSRSEAQGNEAVAKKSGILNWRTQKVEEENPYKKVVSVPEGWRVEINDQRLIEDLTERELTGEKLQKEFIRRFNGLMRDGIGEAVRREKLSNEKDKSFWLKVILSSVNPAIALHFSAQSKFDPVSVAEQVGTVLFMYSLFNITGKLYPFYPIRRKIDHTWEYLMPRVEIDKAVRTGFFLSEKLFGKGRTLVREIREEK